MSKISNHSELYKHVFDKKFAHMTLLGFSAGLPLFLIFSSLSLWLDQVGIKKSAITMFSWAALGYSFKFLWSPLVDKLPIYKLSSLLGQRRSWLLLTQVIIISAILWMAFTNPALGENYLVTMAFATVLLGFSSATQDIVIDAWRIEASNEKDIAILSSLYIVGYRIGMVTSGAGALFLAHYFGTSKENYLYEAWRNSYLIMAMTMLVGVMTTLIIKEPNHKSSTVYESRDYISVLIVFLLVVLSFITVYKFTGLYKHGLVEYLQTIVDNKILINFVVSFFQLMMALVLALVLGGFVYKSSLVNREMIATVYISPVKDLFLRNKNNMWLLAGIIATYRISDIVMGVSANLFYQHMGFDLDEIAGIVKTFGLIMTLTGGILGGVLVIKYSVLRIMIVGAILSAITNLLFMVMAETGKSFEFLVVLISADNLSAGIATAAFVGFLSILVNKSFTAVQYAMFSSVMTLFPKILGGYSGTYVDSFGFSNFFLFTAVIGIPVVIMLVYAHRKNLFVYGKKSTEVSD
ncbi:MAG TPA: MFS transporter [Gammaproteobacteria bacterium]|nr:MFS transporter [Xanthomonadales bacterium]MCB1594210.1 MFS transporter [Xanthomonadales bacterium]HOP22990.1 MFS transporter [Gammaproteobacteria bacterium]HPI96684.1 MFS transporter [Gammaproteobacteria bacterium]HPQ86317.1 MFS transporter [Gammaproteobacteria bacterium]